MKLLYDGNLERGNRLMKQTKARRLSVGEIVALPLASVIWCEEHCTIELGENEIEYHQVLPFMISIPGYEGLLVWGDLDSYDGKRINDNLISDDCIFWDKQPEPEQINYGISFEEVNRICEEYEEPDNIVYLPSR